MQCKNSGIRIPQVASHIQCNYSKKCNFAKCERVFCKVQPTDNNNLLLISVRVMMVGAPLGKSRSAKFEQLF